MKTNQIESPEEMMEIQVEHPLAELQTTLRIRVGSALASVQFLTATAPFCAPVLELVEADLEAALAAVRDAEQLECYLTRLLVGPAVLADSTGR
jgi:hypothetical protein